MLLKILLSKFMLFTYLNLVCKRTAIQLSHHSGPQHCAGNRTPPTAVVVLRNQRRRSLPSPVSRGHLRTQ